MDYVVLASTIIVTAAVLVASAAVIFTALRPRARVQQQPARAPEWPSWEWPTQ